MAKETLQYDCITNDNLQEALSESRDPSISDEFKESMESLEIVKTDDNPMSYSNESTKNPQNMEINQLDHRPNPTVKRKQTKKVTWNKKLIRTKIISPRITKNENQHVPTLFQRTPTNSFSVDFDEQSQMSQLPNALPIAAKQPSTVFKKKCQTFKMKNKNSTLVLSLKS